MTVTLRDVQYFKRLTLVYAGLDSRYQTSLMRTTISNIRELVARMMVSQEISQDDFDFLVDEPWAMNLVSRLVKIVNDAEADPLTKLREELELEFSARLDFRRQNRYNVVYGFYEYSYVISVAYKVLGVISTRHEGVTRFILTLKAALLQKLDLYLIELAPRILGKKLTFKNQNIFTFRLSEYHRNVRKLSFSTCGKH